MSRDPPPLHVCTQARDQVRTRTRAIQQGCTLMSESSLCVAMGTRATLTEAEEKEENSMKRKEKLVRKQQGHLPKRCH